MEAGWSVKRPRENEAISDQDLKNVFDKVDMNRDLRVNRMVGRDLDGQVFSPPISNSCQKTFECDLHLIS